MAVIYTVKVKQSQKTFWFLSQKKSFLARHVT